MQRENYSGIRKGYEPEEPIKPFSWKPSAKGEIEGRFLLNHRLTLIFKFKYMKGNIT